MLVSVINLRGMCDVQELRGTLARHTAAAARREELLRRDLAEVEARSQDAESRHEELTARLPEATRPLLRQIEAMQAQVRFLTRRSLAPNAREWESLHRSMSTPAYSLCMRDVKDTYTATRVHLLSAFLRAKDPIDKRQRSEFPQ